MAPKNFVEVPAGLDMENLPSVDELNTPPTPKKKEEKKVEAKKANGKAAKGAKPAPAVKVTKTKEKETKAPKAEKPAKVAKEKKESVERKKLPQPDKVYPTGTSVKYLGGSRAKNLDKGAVGRITARFGENTVRYGVRFGTGEEARMTVLAAAYVEAVPEKPVKAAKEKKAEK